ncbi:MAG: peptidylprolyl isomerase [Alphaproteobacteria bacterium]|nr:peptidylprolyl isomerase [Alphaproteobacteria bacterium]
MQFRTPVFCAAALFIAASTAVLAQDDALTAESVIASVNGTDITLGHMIVLRARLPEQYQNLPDDVLFQGILDQVVQQAVLSQSIEALSTEAQLVLDNERRALLAAEAVQDAVEASVTDEAVQAAYEANFGNAEPEQEFNASHILVETEEAAAALVTELEGGADFAELARNNSTGPSGPNGGNLGWFGKGMMVPAFEEAVLTLDVGEVSAPVQTQFGWHVITLNETRLKDAPSLDSVRGEIVGQLQREAVDARIAELTAAADVTRIDTTTIDPAILREQSLVED